MNYSDIYLGWKTFLNDKKYANYSFSVFGDLIISYYVFEFIKNKIIFRSYCRQIFNIYLQKKYIYILINILRTFPINSKINFIISNAIYGPEITAAKHLIKNFEKWMSLRRDLAQMWGCRKQSRQNKIIIITKIKRQWHQMKNSLYCTSSYI